jgi:hypothetical protein
VEKAYHGTARLDRAQLRELLTTRNPRLISAVDQTFGAIHLEAAPDLVELLAGIAHQLTGAAHIGQFGRKLQQRELAACYLVLGGYDRLPAGPAKRRRKAQAPPALADQDRFAAAIDRMRSAQSQRLVWVWLDVWQRHQTRPKAAWPPEPGDWTLDGPRPVLRRPIVG